MSFPIQSFEKYINSTILGRGRNYFNKGLVSDLKEEDGTWTSSVEGSYSEYDIEINFDKDKVIHWHCTCPYDGDVCKHVVATLYEIRKKMVKTAEPVESVKAQFTKTTTHQPKEPEQPKIVYKHLPEPKELLTFYEKNLSETERKIVKIGALAWEMMLFTKITEIFNGTFGMSKGANPLSSPQIKVILTKLAEIGYFKDEKAGQFRINPTFAEYLCEQNWHTDNELRHVILPIQNRTPLYFNYHQSASTTNDRHFRDMRFAYYLGNTDQFKQMFNNVANTGKTRHDLLDYYLPQPFNLEKLEWAYSRIRAFLLIEKLNQMFNQLDAVDGYYHYTAEKLDAFDPKDRPNLARLVLRLAILRGEYEVINKVKKHAENSYQLFLKGWESAQNARDQNLLTDALVRFDLSQKALRGERGTNTYYWDGLEGLFFTIALLKTDDENYRSMAQKIVQWGVKHDTDFMPSYKALEAVILYLNNDRTACDAILKALLQKMN